MFNILPKTLYLHCENYHFNRQNLITKTTQKPLHLINILILILSLTIIIWMKVRKSKILYNFEDALESLQKPVEKRTDFDFDQMHKSFYKIPFFVNIQRKKGDQLLKKCIK